MLIKNNLPIILASTSSVRKQILSACAIDFEVVKPLYDEDSQKHLLTHKTPQELAIFLAEQKALSISQVRPDACVIGADQVCELDGKQIFKSHNAKEALEQLAAMSGKQHFQNNSSVVAFGGKIIFSSFARVGLEMRSISNDQLQKYIERDQPWGCAGSYKYESLGKHLFAKVDGDYFAILGLNIQPILSFLYAQNFITF